MENQKSSVELLGHAFSTVDEQQTKALSVVSSGGWRVVLCPSPIVKLDSGQPRNESYHGRGVQR